MLDLKFIRENIAKVTEGLKAKRVEAPLGRLMELDQKRRDLSTKADELRSQQNRANDEIATLLRSKQDAKAKIAAMKEISAEVDKLTPSIKEIEEQIDAILIMLPNIPHATVPVGGPDANKEVKTWGERPKLDFTPKTHIELAEALDIIDFKRGTKLSGSNFILYKREGALLERALYNFMLDVHTREQARLHRSFSSGVGQSGVHDRHGSAS
jgi:seryl-tRNA synthetase